MDNEDIQRINPFDWKSEFATIIDNGGFDVVIGNPPYIKLHNIDKLSLNYFFKNYQTAEKKCDVYAFFVEKVLSNLLKEKGLLGYIISNTWLNLDSFNNLRQIVTKKNKLVSIATLNNPFPNVKVSPIIFFAERNEVKDYKFTVSHFDFVNHKSIDKKEISSQTIKSPDYLIDLTATKESLLLVKKIINNSNALSDIADLYYGIMTADNNKFILSEANNKQDKPLLRGEDISRYKIKWSGHSFIDYRPDEMKKKKTARPGVPGRFEKTEKIIFQRYSSTKLVATLDTSQFYTLGTTIIAHSVSDYSNKYLLGIINSKTLSWWYGRVFTSPTNYIREFEKIPIRKIDFNIPSDVLMHDRMVSLVDQMLQLNKNIANSKTPNEEERTKRQIAATDKQIDALVYELYGLTDDEIRIVEDK
jgi:adenine-specific DNA-methyltransferase